MASGGVVRHSSGCGVAGAAEALQQNAEMRRELISTPGLPRPMSTNPLFSMTWPQLVSWDGNFGLILDAEGF